MKFKLNKAVIYTLLGLVVFVVLVKAVDFTKKSEVVNPSPTTNPLGYIARVETAKGKVYVEMRNDQIILNPFENSIGKQIVIKKGDYPELFKQGAANLSALQAAEYVDPQSSEVFIELSNNQPDHFGFASTYVLLVNPISGEIKEGLNDYQKQD